MGNKLPLFAVSQYTTFPLTFEQDIALYSKLGIQGIEVCEEKLSTNPHIAREQLSMLAESSLNVTSVQPRVHTLFPHKGTTADEPTEPGSRMVRLRETIDLFSQCFPGENIPLVSGGGIAPDYNFCLAHRTARELYPVVADYAAERGISIMFEPLHPVLMNLYTFISTFDEALKLITEINRPNFGLALDVWHIWHEPNIVERLSQLDGLIFGVHIGDWPTQQPRTFSDRLLPGDGVIDLQALLGAIEKTGYEGAYCLEVFSDEKLPDSLWRSDPAQVIRKGREGFQKAWDSHLGSARNRRR